MVHGKKKGMKKKYQAGEATQYISRKHARKRLQLTLADFRRLCILKGIYPREPKNRKKAGKGKASYSRTYYFMKDIQWLSHEPLINKFRDHKVRRFSDLRVSLVVLKLKGATVDIQFYL